MGVVCTLFMCFEAFLQEIDKKNLFGLKRGYLRKKLESTWEGPFFTNQCETRQIQSKTVSNFKISHIGQFSFILVFCIVFVGNRQKLPLWQRVAISEICSDLTKMTYFHQTRETGQILMKAVLNLKMSHIQLILAFHVF